MYHHHHPPIYNDLYDPYSYHHHHCRGTNNCSLYENIDRLPISYVNNIFPRHSYVHTIPPIDYYPCHDYIQQQPIIETNVHNNVYYYLDDAYYEFEDEYDEYYRLSRSKILLVDVLPKPRRNRNRMVVSTFQPRERDTSERIIVPRPTVVRANVNRNSAYEKQRRNMKLTPLNRSAELIHRKPNRTRSVVREIVPVATVENSFPQKRTFRLRQLSPL